MLIIKCIFFSGDKTILLAATRIEVATSEYTNILSNVSDDLKSISSFLNQERKASSLVDISEIYEIIERIWYVKLGLN